MSEKCEFPAAFNLWGKHVKTLRYGENPHQEAALYRTGENRPGALLSTQVQGKDLSYNNILDADAAFECVAEFGIDNAAVVIVKHQTPCGVAVSQSLTEAYRLAHACDPLAVFGGVIALNRHLDVETARLITKTFVEVVICPAADEDALEVCARKPEMRVLLTGGVPSPQDSGITVRSINGGFLIQTVDNVVLGDTWNVVTERAPSEKESEDLRFAFTVVKHAKSNAIVYAKNRSTVGIGGGLVSRVDAATMGAMKGSELSEESKLVFLRTIGSVAASDAFFPHDDGLRVIIDAGATAVIQPGGSKKDQEIIDCANQAGIAMVFTGLRHFRH